MKGKQRRCGTVAVLTVIGLIGWAAQAHASGFGVYTHGAHALSQANAVTAHNNLPSAVFFNPALINELPGTQLETGTTMITVPREFISDTTGRSVDGEGDAYFPSTFFATHAISERLSAGIGFFNPFGLGTEWPQEWEGRYINTKSELTTYNLNPVISWRITPKVSLAAGVAFLWLDATLENKINLTALTTALTGIPAAVPDGHQSFKGDGQGVGYNFGLRVALSDRITWGVSYRSAIDVDTDGRVATDLPDSTPAFVAALFPDTAASAQVDLPRQVTSGLAFQITDKAVAEAGFRWEEWSTFKELAIELDQPVAGQSAKITPRNWDNAFGVNIGGRYKITDSLSILAGYLYETSPVPDETFDPAIQDAESHLFSVGMDFNRSQWQVSLGYGYQMKPDRDKNTAVGDPISGGYRANGKYKSDLHLLGASLIYRF